MSSQNNQSEDSQEVMKIGFDVVELQVISLKPGDVLSIKCVGEEFCNEYTLGELKRQLKRVFTENEVILFAIPDNHDMIIEAIRTSQVDCVGCRGGCENCNPERNDDDETK